MNAPQSGIFALGTASHAYLELDLMPGREGGELIARLASLREPRTTMGVNFVVGFRPELWAATASSDAPPGLEEFNIPVVGNDGYTMPATQHDAVLWLSGSAYDVVFESARDAIAMLAGLASVAEETSSWPYQRDRDLTGSSRCRCRIGRLLRARPPRRNLAQQEGRDVAVDCSRS